MIERSLKLEAARRATAITACQFIVMLGLGAAITGCAKPNIAKRQASAITGVSENYRKQELNLAMAEYASGFSSDVIQAANQIEENADSDAIRRNALLWKLNAIPRAQVACYRVSPLAAQLDMWAFAVQMQAFFTTGAGSSVFGEQQSIAIEASDRMVRDIKSVGLRMSSSPESLDQIEDENIKPWAAANPIQSMEFLRYSAVGQYAEIAFDHSGSLAQISSIEQNIAKVVMMSRIYLAELPRHTRWQAELLVEDTLKDVEEQRIAMTTDIERVVDEAVTAASAEGARAANRVADRIGLRILLVVIAGIVLAPIVARVYLRVWPKGA